MSTIIYDGKAVEVKSELEIGGKRYKRRWAGADAKNVCSLCDLAKHCSSELFHAKSINNLDEYKESRPCYPFTYAYYVKEEL